MAMRVNKRHFSTPEEHDKFHRVGKFAPVRKKMSVTELQQITAMAAGLFAGVMTDARSKRK